MTQPINHSQLYTYDEVCDLLDVSYHWILARRKEGLPAVQIGQRVWIDGGELVAFMKARQHAWNLRH